MKLSVETIKRWLASWNASSRRRRAAERRRPTTLQLENLEPRDLMTVDQTLDDAGAAFSLVGDWTSESDSSAVGTAYHQFIEGSGASGSATWTFSDVDVGKHYEIFAAWPAAGSGEAQFEVLDGGSAAGSAFGEQSAQPGDLVEDGVYWKSLGLYLAQSDDLAVRLAAEGGSGAVADAVRIVERDVAVLKGTADGAFSADAAADSAARADGATVVVWQASTGEWSGSPPNASVALAVQLFDAEGNSLTAMTAVDASGIHDQERPQVKFGPDGGFVVLWTSLVPPDDPETGYPDGLTADQAGWRLYAQRFDAAGEALGSVLDVGIVAPQSRADAAIDEYGGLTIVGEAWSSSWEWGGDPQSAAWDGTPGTGLGLFVHRYDSAGVDLGLTGGPIYNEPGAVSVALHPGGLIVIAGGDYFDTFGLSGNHEAAVDWTDAGGHVAAYGGDETRFSIDRYDDWGSLLGPTIDVYTAWARDLALKTLPDGGFVVAWRSDDASDQGVFAQRFDAAGRAVGGAVQLDPTTEGEQSAPSISLKSDGRVVVSWTSHSSDPALRGLRSIEFVGSGVVHDSTPENASPAALHGSLDLVEDQTDGAVDLFAHFSDAEEGAAALSYEIVGAGGMSFPSAWIDSSSGLLHLAPDADASGSGWVVVRGTDSESLYAESKISVSVAAVADAPVLSVSPASGDEDAAIALSISAALSDTDGSESLQVVTISGVPTGAVLSAAQDQGGGVWKVAVGSLSNLTLTAPANFHGDFDLTISATSVEASNGDYETVEQTLSVSVAPVDDLTTLVAPAALSAAEDVSKAVAGLILQDVDGAVSDFEVLLSVEEGTLSLSGTTGLTFFDDTASGEAVLRFTGGFADVNAALATLQYRGDADDSGEDAIQVEVHALDAEGEVAESIGTAEVALTVAPVADAPTLEAEEVEAVEDQPVELAISVGLADADGSESIQEVRIEGAPAGFGLSKGELGGDGVWRLTAADLAGLTLTPSANAFGTWTLTVAASAAESAGGLAAESTQSFDVVVAAVNDAPTSSAPEDVEVFQGAAPVEVDLAALVSDVDDSAWTWTVEGNTNAALFTSTEIDSEGKLTLSFDTAQFGTAVLTLRATDADEAYTELTLNVSIAENGPPTAETLDDVNVDEDSAPLEIDLSTVFSDPDGDDLTYTVEVDGEPGPLASAETVGGTLVVQFTPNAAGEFVLRLRATDPSGAYAEAVQRVVVAPVADAPSLQAYDVSGNRGEAVSLNLSAALVDLDGSETLVVTISGVPGGASLSAGVDDGDGVWTLSAEDLGGLSISGLPVGETPLTVRADSTEGDSESAAHVETNFIVEIAPVQAYLNVSNASAEEDQQAYWSIGVDLSGVVSSDVAIVRVVGLPTEVQLSAGTLLGDGSWLLSVEEAASDLSASAAADFAGAFDVDVALRIEDAAGNLLAEQSAEAEVRFDAVADQPQLSVDAASGAASAAIDLSIQAAAIDADGSETLVVRISGVPTGATLSAGVFAAGVWTLQAEDLAGLQFVPAAGSEGDVTLTVAAVATESSNGDEEVATADLVISLAEIDGPTVLHAPTSVSAKEDANATALGFRLTDSDGVGGVFRVSIETDEGTLSTASYDVSFLEGDSSGAERLVFEGTQEAVDAALASLVYRGVDGFAGEDEIRIHVEWYADGGGSPVVVGEAEVPVTVSAVADAPLLTADEHASPVAGAVPLTIQAASADPDDSETVSLSISGLPEGYALSAGTKQSDGSWKLAPEDLAGLSVVLPVLEARTYTLTIRAAASESSGGAEAVATAKIDVVQTYAAPLLPSVAVQHLSEQQAWSLQLKGTDPDGPTGGLTYEIVEGAPETLSLNSTTGLLQWTPDESDGGTSRSVVVRVVDGDGLSAQRTIQLQVAEVNAAPVLDPIGDQTLAVGETLTFTASASDADLPTQNLVFSLDPGAPVGATIDSATGEFTWTPGPGAPQGVYVVTVRVSDGGSPELSDYEIVRIAYGAANQAPVLAAPDPDAAYEGTAWSLQLSATDPDGASGAIHYRLGEDAPAGMTIDRATGLLHWTPRQGDRGEYAFTVEAWDSGQPPAIASRTVTVEVFAASELPVLLAFGLLADTGASATDGVTSVAKVAGRIGTSYADGLAWAEFDWDGDGETDYETAIPANGKFSSNAVVDEDGPQETAVRIRFQALGLSNPEYSSWTVLEWEYDPEENVAPDLAGLTVRSIEASTSPSLSSTAQLGGRATDDGSAGSRFVELDFDADGVADAVATLDSRGEFRYDYRP